MTQPTNEPTAIAAHTLATKDVGYAQQYLHNLKKFSLSYHDDTLRCVRTPALAMLFRLVHDLTLVSAVLTGDLQCFAHMLLRKLAELQEWNTLTEYFNAALRHDMQPSSETCLLTSAAEVSAALTLDEFVRIPTSFTPAKVEHTLPKPTPPTAPPGDVSPPFSAEQVLQVMIAGLMPWELLRPLVQQMSGYDMSGYGVGGHDNEWSQFIELMSTERNEASTGWLMVANNYLPYACQYLPLDVVGRLVSEAVEGHHHIKYRKIARILAARERAPLTTYLLTNYKPVRYVAA